MAAGSPAGVAAMSNLKLAGALCAVVGAICLVLVQFLPWGGVSESGGGFSAEVTSYTWKAESSGSFGGFGGSESHGWYDNDADDADGVGQIRTAIPFLLAGLVIAAIGAVVAFGRSAAGPIVVLVGALVAAVGLVLFAMGTDTFYDGEQDWAASFYLAIAGCALAILGGVLGLMAGNAAATRTTGGSY